MTRSDRRTGDYSFGSTPLSQSPEREDVALEFEKASRDAASLDVDPADYAADLAEFDLPDDAKVEFLSILISMMRVCVLNGWDVKQVGSALGISSAADAVDPEEGETK